MKNFIYKNRKYLIAVLVYLIAALTVWSIRDNFLSHIPSMIKEMQYTHTVLDIIILTVVFAGLISIVRLVRCPLQVKQKFDKVCRRHAIKKQNRRVS